MDNIEDRNINIKTDRINNACAETAEKPMILALINDIVRMQHNLDNMDLSTKGVSQLRHRVKSMLTTLSSHGYEIAELLGRSWHDGDNIIGTMELNEQLEPGTSRIKRIIRPQVSFQGKMIQAAEVVIEYNEK